MRISVVIPTFNGGQEIGRLLQRLKEQQPKPPDEIIAIDSGSKDNTRAVVEQFGGRVIDWKQPFNHGLTRDAGIAAATGDIVFLTVQDAVPQSVNWLATVAQHFSDPAVAGVCTRQIPPPDGPLELQIKAQLEAAENPAPVRITLKDHSGYAQYSPAQKLELYRFDDVCSALRRSVWEKVPYGDCRYAEDYQWAKKALEAGHTLVREPREPVIHAHRRTFGYEFRRGLLDAWVLDTAFGYRYSLLKKLNRVKHLAAGSQRVPNQPSPGIGGRLEAFKTYFAHVLARGLYGFYRVLLRPLGLGQGILASLTKGI